SLDGFRSMAYDSRQRLFVGAQRGILVWDHDVNQVHKWSAEEAEGWIAGTKFSAMALSKQKLFVGDEDGYFFSMAHSDFHHVSPVALSSAPILACAVSPDGTLVSIGDGNGTIFVFDAASQILLARFPAFHH